MVLIDMDMPKNCVECPCLRIEKDFSQCRADGRYMYDEDKVWMTEQRPNWCPIRKEVKISREVACHDGNVCW